VTITLPDCNGEIAGGYYDMLTDVGAARYYTFVTPFVTIRSDR